VFQEYRKTSQREVKLCVYYQSAFSLTKKTTLPHEAVPTISLPASSYAKHLCWRTMIHVMARWRVQRKGKKYSR